MDQILSQEGEDDFDMEDLLRDKPPPTCSGDTRASASVAALVATPGPWPAHSNDNSPQS